MKAKTVNKKRRLPQFLYVIKDALVCLVSNKTVIDVGVKRPWWVGVIIALIAIWLPVFPLLKMNLDSRGSNFIAQNSYGVEEHLVRLSYALEYEVEDTNLKNMNLLNAPVDFKVDENYLLDIYVNGTKKTDDVEFAHRDTLKPIANYISHDEMGSQNQLEIYYFNVEREEFSKDVLPRIKNDLEKRSIAFDTVNGAVGEGSTGYTPSLLVFYRNGLYISVFKTDSTTLTTGLSATDWKNLSFDGFMIKDYLLKDIEGSFLNRENNTKVYDRWKVLFDESYLTQRSFNTWFNMLIYLGIYAVLVIFMGLLLFLLTRGKNNMFNYFKFIDCQKMSWWCSLGPAVLGLILGFLIPRFATMAFIVLFGLRVMWMSMKQLRPM